MIGRADIEGSKSYVAMNAWQPQASYPCGMCEVLGTLTLLEETQAHAPAPPHCVRQRAPAQARTQKGISSDSEKVQTPGLALTR